MGCVGSTVTKTALKEFWTQALEKCALGTHLETKGDVEAQGHIFNRPLKVFVKEYRGTES